MKRKKIFKLSGCMIIVILFIVISKNGHINLPGHGNLENQNLEKTVVSHVSSSLINGETVEFDSKYHCRDYKDNDEIRYSANVIYYVISKDGVKEKHIAHVICNEDKDRIIEWKDIDNN